MRSRFGTAAVPGPPFCSDLSIRRKVDLGFSSYWKEIAIALAALFAIAGTVFDVKDRTSHRLTIWGRIFFGLILLSMLGGFYSQWQENANDASRNKQYQDNILKVIENTNRSVLDMSRVLQPLGKSNVYLVFRPNCTELKEFCDAAIKEGEREGWHDDNIFSYSLSDIVWSSWPDRASRTVYLFTIL